MNVRFDGQTVIVTGAAHGFGRAISLAFAERGANVWACDVNRSGLAMTEQQALERNLPLNVRVVDVADREMVREFVREAGAGERLDVLVNNAGACSAKWDGPLKTSVRTTGTRSSG